MARWLYPLLAVVVVAAEAVTAGDPTRAAPFYSLPTDGDWVEFEWAQSRPGEKEVKGLLRVSSVGALETKGERCRWVEVALTWERDGKKGTRVRKLLVAEKPLGKEPLAACVRRCLEKAGADAKPVELPPDRIGSFFDLGLDEQAALREVAAAEEVETGLGKFKARHLTTEDAKAERRRDYHGWLSDKVPFGCVRFEIVERSDKGERAVVHRASAVRSGGGAKSAVE